MQNKRNTQSLKEEVRPEAPRRQYIDEKEEKAQAKLTRAQEKVASRSRLRRITKTRRHAIRTNNRVLKYGAKSFIRNAWLSIAAIAIMTITLVVLAATVIATDVMHTAIGAVEKRVDFSVYIKQSATQKEVNKIVENMKKLGSVTEVKVTSPEQGNKIAIEKMIRDSNITDQDVIQGLHEAPNKLPWVLNVKITNIDDTSELAHFVDNDESTRNMLDAKEPTYKTDNKKAVDNIAAIMERIRIGGLIVAGIFAVIAILVVFNTIRMSIFNRKEEIHMMRLVGASRWFIVGPFVVEAMLYGTVAALITFGGVYGVSFALREAIDVDLMNPTLELMQQYWHFFGLSLLFIGVVIGIISSLLATRKYVKVR